MNNNLKKKLSEKVNWYEYKKNLKEKKISQLEKRLDREIEKKEQKLINENNHEKNQEKIETNKEDINNNQIEKNVKNKRKKSEVSKQNELKKLKDEFNNLNNKKNKKVKSEIPETLNENDLDVKPNKTVSIAVPASIILNCQTPELKTYLISQIARCAVIFNCYEIVVFDEHCTNGNYDDEECIDENVVCVRQMARVLKYLECPQYLRKSLFPLNKDFRYAGVTNPLNARHHLKYEDECEFREGVVNSNKKDKSFIYVGLKKEVIVNKVLEPGTRVTVQLDIFEEKNYRNGKIVSPYMPTKLLNYYWGYDVRIANSLSSVINECPYAEKYDLVIGTSDKGDLINDLVDNVQNFNHALVVFGSIQGLEFAVKNDKTIKDKQTKELFDYYVNTCPNQGTSTIRTEEAILISLSKLSCVLFKY